LTDDICFGKSNVIWDIAETSLNMRLHPAAQGRPVAFLSDLAAVFDRNVPNDALFPPPKFPVHWVGEKQPHRNDHYAKHDANRDPYRGDERIAECGRQRSPGSGNSRRNWPKRESIHGNDGRKVWPFEEWRFDEFTKLRLPVLEVHNSRNRTSVGPSALIGYTYGS
jgi:hypothetical protein